MITGLSDRIFNLRDKSSFSQIALEIFRLQAEKNPVYKSFIFSLGKNICKIKDISDLPFLPAEFFKSQKVIIENISVEKVFESSTTGGASPSRHFVSDLRIYEESFQGAFRLFYGDPADYFITALLPSYIERQNSSLIYMMDKLIKKSLNEKKGFYSNDHSGLVRDLHNARSANYKTILLGVSFALMDLAEKYPCDLSGTVIMETGGMKGRREEITREELHKILKQKLNVSTIHSEYGMTELLSQAYSKGEGLFYAPPWMKILIRDPQDPLSLIGESGRTGGINIIDLANINSCSFIATGDLGRLHEDGGFEVLGRFDNSDIRGCNLIAD